MPNECLSLFLELTIIVAFHLSYCEGVKKITNSSIFNDVKVQMNIPLRYLFDCILNFIRSSTVFVKDIKKEKERNLKRNFYQ